MMPNRIPCILLIDDDPDDNFLHKLVIAESGLVDTVRVAESGPEALHYLTHTDTPTYLRPNVILLDINMPGMNGFEFLEEYHQLPESMKSNVVVMMLTTSLNPTDIDRADNIEEISGYRNKPLTRAMLDEIVKHYFS